MEVGDDGAAGEGSFGGVEGYRITGAWLQVGQLVLLLVAFHKESISRHWKTQVKHSYINMFTTFSPSHIYSVCTFVGPEAAKLRPAGQMWLAARFLNGPQWYMA